MRVTIVNNNKDSTLRYQDLKPGDVFKFVSSNCRALKVCGGHVLFDCELDGAVVYMEPEACTRDDNIDMVYVIYLGTLIGLEVIR